VVNLEFRKQTTTIAFAEDLLIAVKAKGIREAENITNIKMNKISILAKNNKIDFNEQKFLKKYGYIKKEKKIRKFQFT